MILSAQENLRPADGHRYNLRNDTYEEPRIRAHTIKVALPCRSDSAQNVVMLVTTESMESKIRKQVIRRNLAKNEVVSNSASAMLPGSGLEVSEELYAMTIVLLVMAP